MITKFLQKFREIIVYTKGNCGYHSLWKNYGKSIDLVLNKSDGELFSRRIFHFFHTV